MPTFHTPEPITADIEVVSGSVNVVASDRGDTVVQVSPRDPSRAADIRIAEGARVDFRNGTLTVSAGRRIISLGNGGAVIIDIELPSRSRLQVSTASAQVRADGAFSDCRFATASGDATVETVTGNLKADSASGDVTIGELTGDAKFRAASGSLAVRHLIGTVNAQTASGDTGVATAENGTISVQTAGGDVEIGIPEGTAARLDVRTHSGHVRNTLQASDGPVDGDETVTVHVRTGSGDVRVQRATAGVAG
jgi:Putative adhesin